MWTGGRLVAEGFRNLRGVARIIVGATLTLLLLAGGLLEADTTADAMANFDNWVARGGMVMTVERANGLDGLACNSASDDKAILLSGGAGTLEATETIVFDRSPGVHYTLQPMAAQSIEIVAGEMPTQGWIIGAAAVDELGSRIGDSLTAGSNTSHVALVFGGEQRMFGYDRDVLVPVPSIDRTFPICWLEFDPSAFGLTAELASRRFPNDAFVRPFRRTEDRDHPAAVYQRRQSKSSWLATGLVGGVILQGWFWVRRREFILYRSLGASRAGLLILGLTESSALIVPAAVIAAAATTQITDNPTAAMSGVWTITTAALVSLLLAHLAMVPIATRNVASSSRDL